MVGTPTIRVHPNFDARADAEGLMNAMKGSAPDKAKIVDILCHRCNAQRQHIAYAFNMKYGKELRRELKIALQGDLEDLMVGLMCPAMYYDAKELHRAMKGLGTRESVLIEILCSRSNAEIRQIRDAYFQLYEKHLEKDVAGETSFYLKELLVMLCTAKRNEMQEMDHQKAVETARQLLEAGEARFGTDESCFVHALAEQSHLQLSIVFEEYEKLTEHRIEKAIESEFSGHIKAALLAIVGYVRSPTAYFARLIYNSMKGLGTRDRDLIRLIITRSEVDLADVAIEYERMYNTTLEEAIASDCKGTYKNALITILKGN